MLLAYPASMFSETPLVIPRQENDKYGRGTGQYACAFGSVLIEITMPYRDQGAYPTPMTWLVSAKEDISRLRQNEIGVWARSS